jgi:hypothetical protein
MHSSTAVLDVLHAAHCIGGFRGALHTWQQIEISLILRRMEHRSSGQWPVTLLTWPGERWLLSVPDYYQRNDKEVTGP